MLRARRGFQYGLMALALLALLWIVHHQENLQGVKVTQNPSSLSKSSSARTVGPSAVIPNIVHYVWALRDPDGRLQFEFKHFASVYSTFLYLHPDTIYIHTNARPAVVAAARRDATNLWTRKILEIPGVKVRQVEMPTHTRHGAKLEHLEHRSDFARPSILREFGGVYLDFDVVPIRDLKPLRESGFRNIFGHELRELVNNGVMLAVRGSRFMDVLDRDQHEAFDGRWTEHSVHQLTRMANAVMAVPNEVLILERQAFIPDGWDHERHARLFRMHETQAMMDFRQHEVTSDDLARRGFSYWAWSKASRRQEWERDYSKSYTIHALSPTITIENRTSDCFEISWGYVMKRNSNYAAQIYPAMSHADKKLSITKSLIENK